VVPLYDQDKILQSLQFIGFDGDKKFLGGGRSLGVTNGGINTIND
jgi:phage/plasmid primase-like uncharacterized protein